MVRKMYEVHFHYGRRALDLMMMLSLNETIYQLAINAVCIWYGHVLRREDGYAIRRALEF